jgi:hypothetical protein
MVTFGSAITFPQILVVVVGVKFYPKPKPKPSCLSKRLDASWFSFFPAVCVIAVVITLHQGFCPF